ncbi:CobW family GTP-binding protein [Alcaligenes endophyticus]|uniref:GTP-binding protein n=1 Tax=Alcaligenes endophyticus TaxID=1929088 RepID=A0ABT8EL09_9BURK|nr:GTP-binding protein [Alcaligenes endophyticus]MCX5590675.1 GTP-binding protein [Alcaligenes endophyticus]MDN4121961.1 GTP-binding protein [Alcaligenes endophyticus]
MSTTLTPITLLTGFLGSGKTSLLKRMIHQPQFARCAVIINEFGDVGLDQALVSDSADDQDIQLLDSGCLCCQSSSAIQDVLSGLYYKRLRKEIPWFDRVLIETSGLAEPGPIINSILGDSSLNRQYRVGGVITTFDASFGEQDTNTYDTAELQLMMADTIVLTKLDLPSSQSTPALEEWLKHKVPAARVLNNRLPDGELAQALLQTADHALAPVIEGHNLRANSPLKHLFTYGISSLVVDLPKPVSWPAWADFVRHIQTHFGEQLLRLKGVIQFEKAEDIRTVHAVHHLFSAPEPATAIPKHLIGKLVFIVRDLEHDCIQQAVEQLRHAPNNPN